MAFATESERERLRLLGRLDLGDYIEIATGESLWTKQHEISTALSEPHAQVAVASCNASGKTWLAARIALAFYDTFRPGSACDICGGPCGGAKIITTSSKDKHLTQNLWGEIRIAWPKMDASIGLDGHLMPSANGVVHEPNHFITGLVTTTEEGFQGYHAAHILIIGDEATSVDEPTARGITGLLASGDARLLLIFNPTDTTTYAYTKWSSPLVKSFTISAYDTPNFTHEYAPPGAQLITPEFLEDLKATGQGEGTYEWTTRVLGQFWDLSEDVLINESWYEDRRTGLMLPGGTRSIGIDLASYGTAENVLAFRDGNVLSEIRAVPSMRQDLFFQTTVTKAVLDFAPHYVIYDADGVGAGVIGYAEALYASLPPGAQVIGFRGNKKIVESHTNARSMWYWQLRRHFESGIIVVSDRAHHLKLKKQLTQIRYKITGGAIQVETKDDMRKRGLESPDRADAVMYAFAYSGDLPVPIVKPQPKRVEEWYELRDNSDAAMWERDRAAYDKPEVHPILGVEDW